MRIFFIAFMELAFLSNNAISQHRLEIEITEFRNDKGLLMLQLFDDNRKIVAQAKENITLHYQKRDNSNFLPSLL